VGVPGVLPLGTASSDCPLRWNSTSSPAAMSARGAGRRKGSSERGGGRIPPRGRLSGVPRLSRLRDPGLFFIHSTWRDEATFAVHADLPHTVRPRDHRTLDRPAERNHPNRTASPDAEPPARARPARRTRLGANHRKFIGKSSDRRPVAETARRVSFTSCLERKYRCLCRAPSAPHFWPS
jgi:hypothetical protein